MLERKIVRPFPNHSFGHSELEDYYKKIEKQFDLPSNSLFVNTGNVSLPPCFPNGLFNMFFVRKSNGTLDFRIPRAKNPELEYRRDNLIKLINQANQTHDIADFPYIIIGFDDRPVHVYMNDHANENRFCYIKDLVINCDQELAKHKIVLYHPESLANTNRMKDYSSRNVWFPVLSPCTDRNLYDECLPDFGYESWKGPDLDYKEITSWLLNYNEPAQEDTMGWRGSDNNLREMDVRKNLCHLTKNLEDFDCKFINDTGKEIENFISIKDMVKRYRYLIDVEGYGYSGRVKYLLHAPRVLFLVWRSYQEDFYQYLEPWKHFVPVEQDLLDLPDKLKKIKNNPEMEKEIIANAQEFARTYLSQSSAVQRMASVLNSISKPYITGTL